ncbi:heme biosynthesis HemY N-terminal domain-containing protein [Limnohabitans sp.]|uniref:heme biosynthesis HemY N-terminal domain-containing protein n=1 Tax=Limnohabitans sp. TaxID=1907725 RepID=UPI00286F0495|nr:heme biosynthesis HemY N-terminal domain-containing protein [Limnohabitans sp.]
MRAALWFVALFGVAVASALLIGGNQSTVTVFWSPYRVDLSLNLVLLVLLVLFVMLHLAWRAMSALFELPHLARRWRLQQKERAMHAALLDALSELWSGRYVRATKSAEKALALEHLLASVRTADDVAPRHAHQLRAVSHLVAAESAHALRDRDARVSHLQAVMDMNRDPSDETVEETREAAYLAAARWAMSDRDAPEAMRWLDGLRHGAARRMLALRMRLKVARLNQQHASALDTARLLAKHGAFSDAAGQSLLRELAVASLNEAHDSAQLQHAWDRLEPTERNQPDVVLHAAQRMLKLSGEAATVMPWLTPLWNRMVQQPDSCSPAVRERVAQALARALVLLPADPDWLDSIERARQTYPRWVELQYLAGMVCWHHALWGKAQQMLEQAAPQLAHADMQRQAWRTLAQLAEQKEDTVRAQLCWKRAAEV